MDVILDGWIGVKREVKRWCRNVSCVGVLLSYLKLCGWSDISGCR